MCNCHNSIFTKRIGNRREAFALLMEKIVRVNVFSTSTFQVKFKRYMRTSYVVLVKSFGKTPFSDSKNCSKVICGYCI